MNYYSERIIKEYSDKLSNELGKKYTKSLLWKMRQFYYLYEKVPIVLRILTWSSLL